jgi:hypothetical protein
VGSLPERADRDCHKNVANSRQRSPAHLLSETDLSILESSLVTIVIPADRARPPSAWPPMTISGASSARPRVPCPLGQPGLGDHRGGRMSPPPRGMPSATSWWHHDAPPRSAGHRALGRAWHGHGTTFDRLISGPPRGRVPRGASSRAIRAFSVPVRARRAIGHHARRNTPSWPESPTRTADRGCPGARLKVMRHRAHTICPTR